MNRFREWFDPGMAKDFAQAVPALRRRFGRIPLDAKHDGYGVGPNTFRALRGFPKRPSYVYQLWAARQVTALDANALERRIVSRQAFVEWHSSMVRGLQVHWTKEMGSPLSFAHSHKLVDLFVKWLSKRDHGSARITAGFIVNANCALDSQVLSKLNDCLSKALPISNPSMKDIHNHGTYQFCQAAIAEFAEANGGTRLLFDEYAWKRGG